MKFRSYHKLFVFNIHLYSVKFDFLIMIFLCYSKDISENIIFIVVHVLGMLKLNVISVVYMYMKFLLSRSGIYSQVSLIIEDSYHVFLSGNIISYFKPQTSYFKFDKFCCIYAFKTMTP